MREVLKKVFIKLFLNSEKEFLRQQIKDLQMQVVVMANKQMEYVNAKIATSVTAEEPRAINPETGLPDGVLTKEQKQELAEELKVAFGAN